MTVLICLSLICQEDLLNAKFGREKCTAPLAGLQLRNMSPISSTRIVKTRRSFERLSDVRLPRSNRSLPNLVVQGCQMLPNPEIFKLHKSSDLLLLLHLFHFLLAPIFVSHYSCQTSRGRDPFDHNFRKFRYKIKWNRTFLEIRFENCGQPPEVVLFSGNLEILEISCTIWHFYPVRIDPTSFSREKLQDGGE